MSPLLADRIHLKTTSIQPVLMKKGQRIHELHLDDKKTPKRKDSELLLELNPKT
jgi:hypothetical protein